jgi:hypothetical protein
MSLVLVLVLYIDGIVRQDGPQTLDAGLHRLQTKEHWYQGIKVSIDP